MMGSEIKVRSTLGDGSVFWFDLDLPEVSGWQELNQSESRRLVGFKGHKRKVLIGKLRHLATDARAFRV